MLVDAWLQRTCATLIYIFFMSSSLKMPHAHSCRLALASLASRGLLPCPTACMPGIVFLLPASLPSTGNTVTAKPQHKLHIHGPTIQAPKATRTAQKFCGLGGLIPCEPSQPQTILSCTVTSLGPCTPFTGVGTKHGALVTETNDPADNIMGYMVHGVFHVTSSRHESRTGTP